MRVPRKTLCKHIVTLHTAEMKDNGCNHYYVKTKCKIAKFFFRSSRTFVRVSRYFINTALLAEAFCVSRKYCKALFMQCTVYIRCTVIPDWRANHTSRVPSTGVE